MGENPARHQYATAGIRGHRIGTIGNITSGPTDKTITIEAGIQGARIKHTIDANVRYIRHRDRTTVIRHSTGLHRGLDKDRHIISRTILKRRAKVKFAAAANAQIITAVVLQ